MGYQAFTFWGWMIGAFVAVFGVILFSAGMTLLLDIEATDDTTFIFLMEMVMIFAIFGLWGLFFLVGVVGAVLCLMGRNFSYPIIGSWLRKKLFAEGSSEAEIEGWEDSWVGGVCHSTAILQMWGIITPLIIWFSQKGKSAKLRFQAMQAAIYQLIAFIAYILGMVVYMVFIFLMMFGMILLGGTSTAPNGELPPVAGAVSMIFFIVIMILYLLMMVATPIYFLLAAVGSIRTIRGHNFKYPILGHIMAHRMGQSALKEEGSS
jgi:uncharacterized Tic20 family protein